MQKYKYFLQFAINISQYNENSSITIFKSESAFEKDEISILRPFSLNDILYFENNRANTSKQENFSVIKNWVYKMLEHDMKQLFKDNKRK